MKPSNLSKANQWRGMFFRRIVALSINFLLFLFSTEWIFQNILTYFLKDKLKWIGCNYDTLYYKRVQFPSVRHVVQLLTSTDNCAHVMSYIENVQVETHTDEKTNSWEKLNTKEICAHKSNMILLWWNKWQQINRDWFLSLFTTHVWEYNQLIFHDSLHVSGNPLLVLCFIRFQRCELFEVLRLPFPWGSAIVRRGGSKMVWYKCCDNLWLLSNVGGIRRWKSGNLFRSTECI